MTFSEAIETVDILTEGKLIISQLIRRLESQVASKTPINEIGNSIYNIGIKDGVTFIPSGESVMVKTYIEGHNKNKPIAKEVADNSKIDEKTAKEIFKAFYNACEKKAREKFPDKKIIVYDLEGNIVLRKFA